MTMASLDPHALECLAAIVEEGGFERAAIRLSVTQSAVSQRLRALETQVGTVLIVRSRPVRPTTAGRLLLRHAMQLRVLRADLDHGLRELAPDAPAVHDEERISIAVNADSIATWVLPALGGLVRAGVPLEIITDDQDFTHNWLRDGQVLGCVTALDQPLHGCRMVALGAMPYVAVANAEFARRHCPHGLTAHNFRDMPFIAFNRKDGLQAQFVQQACGLRRVALRQRYVPSSEGQVQAVRDGWGASVVPEAKVRPWLASGELVRLAGDTVLPVTLYWHCWNLESPLLDALTRCLIDTSREVLHAVPSERRVRQDATLPAHSSAGVPEPAISGCSEN